MKLKDYIREGYNIVTTPNLAYKIQEDYPNAFEYYDSPNNKYLDRKIIGHKRDM